MHPFVPRRQWLVSRLLWLLQSYQLGFEVGRYISLERLVEQNKERYYETLEQSSQGFGTRVSTIPGRILARDKTSLDIFWLKDKSLANLDNLPEPDELAGEIIEKLEAGLESFLAIAAALK